MAVEIFGEKRLGVVCREITKKFEDAKRGNLKELSDFYRNHKVKGEIVILIDGVKDAAGGLDLDRTKIETHLKEALRSMSVRLCRNCFNSTEFTSKRRLPVSTSNKE